MEALGTRSEPVTDLTQKKQEITPQPQPLGEIRFNSPGYAYGEMDGGTQEAMDLLTMFHKSP